MSIPEKGLAFVVFSAPWCGPCKAYHKTLEEAKAEGVNVVDVDIDKEGGLASEYRIMSVPTSILFDDGRPIGQLLGVQSKDNVSGMWTANGGELKKT